MKTLIFVMTLAFSLGAFASENMGPSSDRTLCAEERENTKVNLGGGSEDDTKSAGAVQG